MGNKRRTTEATNANQTSSRSHAIFQVNVNSKPKTKGYQVENFLGKLSLIDLAGSERGTVTENRGIRLLEGAKINRSLLALANCINPLDGGRKLWDLLDNDINFLMNNRGVIFWCSILVMRLLICLWFFFVFFPLETILKEIFGTQGKKKQRYEILKSKRQGEARNFISHNITIFHF